MKRLTETLDKKLDKKQGVKENSPQDKKLDKYDGRKAPMKKLGMRMSAMKKAVK